MEERSVRFHLKHCVRVQLDMFRKKVAAFWRLLLLIVLGIAWGSQLFQPMLGLAQNSQTIYLKTGDVAIVYNATSYYNATAGAASQGLAPSTQSGFEQLSQLTRYSGGSNSVVTVTPSKDTPHIYFHSSIDKI